jgi:hypothetical protein
MLKESGVELGFPRREEAMRPLPVLALLLGFFAFTWPAPAVEKEAIDVAVARGVAFVRQDQQPNGTWGTVQIGITSLNALTLLECGIPPDEQGIQKAAAAIRKASVGTIETYSLALNILFLDRLGEPSDVPLIESMVVRLLAGQHADGAWDYNCPNISAAEIKRLSMHLQQQNELIGRRTLPDGKEQPKKRTAQDLPKEIQQQLAVIGRLPPAPGIQTDNSNTQFATLALWVARKHGLPVDKALGRVEAHFRGTQNAEGGWGYTLHIPGSTAAMTCAGLLGLAVAHGAALEIAKEKGADTRPARDLAKDPAIKRGLGALSTAVGKPVGRPDGGARVIVPVLGGKAFYYLWSLERLMVALDMDTLAGKDWFNWGAELLLASQRPNGSWEGDYGAAWHADTCFALLYLRRANLARDLTVNLRGRIKDGEVVLRSGGLGGDNLRQGKLPVEIKDKPSGSEKTPGKEPTRDPGKEPRNPPEPRDPPKPPQGSESARLARELVEAATGQKERTLERMREGKGVVYTEALAAAIPQLNGETLRKDREALAERLTRMRAETLQIYLKDEDREIRRAAALACAMKDSKDQVPYLIPLLNDPEPLVIRAAHLAIKELTGQTFGPTREVWQAWWDKQKK